LEGYLVLGEDLCICGKCSSIEIDLNIMFKCFFVGRSFFLFSFYFGSPVDEFMPYVCD
jgi:hypothetical protein